MLATKCHVDANRFQQIPTMFSTCWRLLCVGLYCTGRCAKGRGFTTTAMKLHHTDAEQALQVRPLPCYRLVGVGLSNFTGAKPSKDQPFLFE